jgi:hypothetical protein
MAKSFAADSCAVFQKPSFPNIWPIHGSLRMMWDHLPTSGSFNEQRGVQLDEAYRLPSRDSPKSGHLVGQCCAEY